MLTAPVNIDRRFDALNFFLADVRGGLGPYVGVFLLTQASWTSAGIGGVLTLSGLIGIVSQAPVGALIDATRAKRALIAVGIGCLAACAIAIERMPTVPVVMTADIVMAVLGGVFAPTVAAITLGVVAPADFARRTGRNAAFDRLGNMCVAALGGLVGWWFGQRLLFWLVPLFALPAIAVVFSIPARLIDHERARGLVERTAQPRPESGWRFFTGHRVFLGVCLAALLFHLGNGSMLPIVAQELALSHPGEEAPLVSACILIAQLAGIGAGVLVAKRANQFGHFRLLLVACVALVARGLVFAATDHLGVALAAQVLDGLGIGLFDALTPLVLADLMQGTGHYNLARGVLGTVQGVGGSVSNLASGLLIVRAGYGPAFLFLAASGAAAAGVLVAGLFSASRVRG